MYKIICSKHLDTRQAARLHCRAGGQRRGHSCECSGASNGEKLKPNSVSIGKAVQLPAFLV